MQLGEKGSAVTIHNSCMQHFSLCYRHDCRIKYIVIDRAAGDKQFVFSQEQAA